jgi:LAS superfamily LD-carboxypeptidase LdcB
MPGWRFEGGSLAGLGFRCSNRPVRGRIRGSILAAVALLAVSLAYPAPAQDAAPRCVELSRPDRRSRNFVAQTDLFSAPAADGNDLLALVNRTPSGGLASSYRPDDLVDLATMRPARAWECVPPRKQCLRRDAADAYQRLAAAMRAGGMRPYVSSAFRAYHVQCSTFLGWAARERGGFCEAVTASAIPGHSQHQLGTAIDLFEHQWNLTGNRFREGFGCTPAGRWIAAHAHEYGYLLPYPLHPDYLRDGSDCAAVRGAESWIDPRTGYRYEPWHLRYVGVENAARYREAWRASGPGTASEITLEQWLRRLRNVPEPIGAPVCDGCNCDECATFASESERSPCRNPALRLDRDGRPLPAARAPRLIEARVLREGERVIVEARVEVPQNTLTQPPIVTPRSGVTFARGQPHARLSPRAQREYPDLPSAWRLAIRAGDGGAWTWRAALAGLRRDGAANGINARLPAPPGELTLSIPLEGVAAGTAISVALGSGAELRDVRSLRAP